MPNTFVTRLVTQRPANARPRLDALWIAHCTRAAVALFLLLSSPPAPRPPLLIMNLLSSSPSLLHLLSCSSLSSSYPPLHPNQTGPRCSPGPLACACASFPRCGDWQVLLSLRDLASAGFLIGFFVFRTDMASGGFLFLRISWVLAFLSVVVLICIYRRCLPVV